MIRKAGRKENDAIMRLWLDGNLSAHSFVEEDYWKSSYGMVKEMLPEAELYVWEEEKEIMGFAGVTDSYLAGIFVKERERSKGIGKKLLDQIKREYDHLSLHVYEKNERAVRFYMREGFTVQGKETDENTGEPEYLMEWNRGKTREGSRLA